MKIYYPKDKDGNSIGFRTPESYVYDENGNNLSDKLNDIDDEIDTKANKSYVDARLQDNACKNLLDYRDINTRTSASVTYKNNNDGTFTMNGTANGWGGIEHLLSLSLGTYTFSTRETYDNINVWISYNGSHYTNGDTFEIIDDSNAYFVIQVQSGETVEDLTIAAQIEYGTEATEYEQFFLTNRDLKKEIDEIEVGGTNLLLSTNQGTAGWGIVKTDATITTESVTVLGVNAYKLTITSTDSNYLVPFYAPVNHDKMVVGETYTLSFDIYSSIEKNFWVSYETGDGKYRCGEFTAYDVPAGEWYHHEKTTTFNDVDPNQGQGIYFSLNTVGEYIIANLKLEKGNKATDWSPAPEDKVSNGDLSSFDFSTLSDDQITQLKTALGLS